MGNLYQNSYVVRLLLGIMRGATIMMTSLNSDNHLYDLDNHDYADNARWQDESMLAGYRINGDNDEIYGNDDNGSDPCCFSICN